MPCPPPFVELAPPSPHDFLPVPLLRIGQPALVLIHGFGASVYHWRYNIPALVKEGYRVLALDLLGFGLSDKPIIEYSAETWRDQVCSMYHVASVLRRAPHTQLWSYIELDEIAVRYWIGAVVS